MRLLQYDEGGQITLTGDLVKGEIPSYAILSHTWGQEEVTFQDLTNSSGGRKIGYEKIRFCMQQAARDGIHHSWIDTCCIDKTDNTELQNAINSMFRWYAEAAACYVYLSDVSTLKRKADSESYRLTWEPAVRFSRWFTRGWTLQELLAPRHLSFFSREGRPLGSLSDLSDLVHSITNLPTAALKGASLDEFSVDQRLAWTKNRRTTREEDKAYSLLGIFGIFMPLIYGEGEENAFRRLQKEIRERRYATQAYLGLSERDFACLQSLSFPEQEHRHNDIHRAVGTCGWLLQDSKFNLWLRRSHGFLWVKGDPGSGKSVLMKHAVRSAKVRSPKELVVSYFIHGQGSELQKTPVGVYRALLNSLLGHFPTCLSKLVTVFEDRESRFGGYSAGRWSWAGNELEESLTDLLVNHTQQHQVTIFVDALDECGERPARKLMAYFGTLSELAGPQKAKIRICLSSRYYPILGIDDFPSISVEERNREDIKWFVNDRLRTLGSSPTRQKVLEEIMSKAQGGFQWALLVTDLIIDRKLSGRRVLGQVASCPSTLSDLYASLLNDITEMEKRQAIKLFRWIIFARRPMSAQELREALVTDPDMSCSSAMELRDVEQWSETMEDFQRYATCISRGLISFKSREFWEQWEESDHEAQLVHQSVADFLVEGFLMDEGMTSASAGHFLISRSCLRYVVLQDILDSRQQERDKLSSQFPLGPYAVRYVFDHIKHAEEAGLVQSDLLSALRWSPRSETMNQLANVWKILNPNNLGTPSSWPFIGSSELHVLAALGSRSALLTSLQNYTGDLYLQDLNGNSPLHIAIAEGHTDVANLLLDWHSNGKQRDHMKDKSCKRTSSSSQDITSLHLDAQNDEGDTALDIAVTMMATATVLRLMESGASAQRMSQPHQLLPHAIKSGNIEICKKLNLCHADSIRGVYLAVQHDAPSEIFLEFLKAAASYFNHPNWVHHAAYRYSGHTTLQLACHLGLRQKVGLLLDHGVSALTRGNDGRCPLHAAVTDDYKVDHRIRIEIIKLLLQHGPTAVDLKDYQGRTALDIAFRSNRTDIIAVLLENGRYLAPSKSLTNFFLNKKTVEGVCQVLKIKDPEEIMLRVFSGIDPNLIGKETHTTLLWEAAAKGQTSLVKRLVKEGMAAVNIPDTNHTSPLLVAVLNRHIDIIETLTSARGIDVNRANKQRVRPLHAAVANGDCMATQLLLRVKDIDVNARDAHGVTPFARAVEAGHSMIQAALLDKKDLFAGDRLLQAIVTQNAVGVESVLRCRGVDVNAGDWKGNSLLSVAVQLGNARIVQLLLQRPDIDVNSKYLKGASPLAAAISCGRKHLMTLLLLVPTIDITSIDQAMKTSLRTMFFQDASLLDLFIYVDFIGHGPEWHRFAKRESGTLVKPPVLLIDSIRSRARLEEHYVATLAEALLAGRIDVVELLLRRLKFAANLTDAYGRSMLNLAVKSSNAAVVKELIKTNMCDPNMIDRSGSSPLWTAISSRNPDIVKLLLDTETIDLNIPPGMEPVPSILWWAAEQADKTIYRMLLATGRVDLNETNAAGESLLFWAVRNGKEDVLRSLLDTGKADVNQADYNGMSPIRYAEQNGPTTLAELLQSHSQTA